jgi:hypothetical protein
MKGVQALVCQRRWTKARTPPKREIQMTVKKSSNVLWFALAVALVGLLLLAWPPYTTQAGPNLPSRATPTPTSSFDDGKDERPVGTYIELQVQGAIGSAWTVVQWQDSAGGWHDVEGWQGTLHEGRRVWWVAAKNFGEGPFRWRVYQALGGGLLAESEPFYLPDSAGETLTIAVLPVP